MTLTFYLVWFMFSHDGRWTSHVTTMSDFAACQEQALNFPNAQCIGIRK